jgi:hypothetical protein
MNDIQVTSTQILIITLLATWELIWKGFALWKAGRKNDKLWFILILVFNTAGILPIVYIFLVSKGKQTDKEE